MVREHQVKLHAHVASAAVQMLQMLQRQFLLNDLRHNIVKTAAWERSSPCTIRIEQSDAPEELFARRRRRRHLVLDVSLAVLGRLHQGAAQLSCLLLRHSRILLKQALASSNGQQPISYSKFQVTHVFTHADSSKLDCLCITYRHDQEEMWDHPVGHHSKRPHL